MWVFDGEEWINDSAPETPAVQKRTEWPEEMQPELQIIEITPVAPPRPFLPHLQP